MLEKIMQKIDCQKLRATISDAEMRRLLVYILDEAYQTGYQEGYSKAIKDAMAIDKKIFGW